MVSCSNSDIYFVGAFITQSTQSTCSLGYFSTLLIVIHASSLMALLNSRNYVRNGGQEQESYSLSFDAPKKSRKVVSSSALIP